MTRLGPLRSRSLLGRLRAFLVGSSARELFEEDVTHAFEFLFREHNGTLASGSEGYPAAMEAAAIEIAAGKLKINVVRHRGELSVYVLDRNRATGWIELDVALTNSSPIRKRPSWTTLDELAVLLQHNWNAVERYCLL